MLNQGLRWDQNWALYADHASLNHLSLEDKLQGLLT